MGSVTKIKVRLYRQHDLDLISLYKNKNFAFVYAIRRSLDAYVNGDTISIVPPEGAVLPNEKLPYMIQINMRLDSTKEADKNIIALLSAIKPGLRNSFVKNLLRSYIAVPTVDIFLEKAEMSKDTEIREKVEKSTGITIVSAKKDKIVEVPKERSKSLETVEKEMNEMLTDEVNQKRKEVKIDTITHNEQATSPPNQPTNSTDNQKSDSNTSSNNSVSDEEQAELDDMFAGMMM